MNKDKKIALVTGSNRGIGLATAELLCKKGVLVILSSRDEVEGHNIEKNLKSKGCDVDYRQLEVTDPKSIAAAAAYVKEKYSRLDILINNAGVLLDRGENHGQAVGILDVDIDLIRKSMEINVYGPIALIQAFVPLMRESDYGRIVNVSTQMGQLSSMGSGYPSYRISKASLNAVSIIAGSELKKTGIKVNSVHPGWIRTRMGGKSATYDVNHAAEGIVYAAMLPDDGPTATFIYDREKIEW